MKLYAYRNCPFSRRVRIALAELDVEYEYVETAPDEEHAPELVGKVPSKTGVPVLFVRDDLVIWDSAAAMFWLDASYPKSLTPSVRDTQAIARSWVGWAASTLYPVLHAMETSQGSEQGLVEAFREIEPFLGEERWLCGPDFTIADVSLAPAVAMLSSKAIEALPETVRAYVSKLRSRPTVREVCELDLPESGERPSKAA
jgi:glutathione S-transferase